MKEGIDIAERDAQTVRRILSSVLPHSAKVLIFGSRANWSAKEFSDLDVAVDAGRKLKIGELAALEDGFADSDLPYRVDVVDLKAISTDFAERVLTQAKPFSYGSSSEWIYKRLGDVLELKRGYDLPQQERRSGNVPIISSSGEVGFHDRAMADAPGVVTGRYGTIGKVFFVDRPYWPLNTALYVRNFKGNDAKFIYYLLKTLDWAQFNDKSGVPGVNRNHVHELSVEIPPLQIQRWIAQTLSSLDEKKELNRRMNETLEAMAQAIFRDWFVDFGPTRRKLEGASDPLTIMGGLVQDAERAQTLADLFPAALGGDGLPKGWNAGRLDELAEVHMGASPKGDTYNEDGIGTPLANGPVEFGDYFLVEKKWTTSPTRLSQVGDFVICVRGSTTGRHVFADGVYCLGRGVAALRGFHGEQDFVNATIILHLDTLLQKTTGSVFPNLSGDDIRSFSCLVPPKAVRRQFSLLAEPLRMRIWHNIHENRTLAATRDLLLPKLMSGEIRLSEAEALMEAAQ